MTLTHYSPENNTLENLSKLVKKHILLVATIAFSILESSPIPPIFYFLIKRQEQQYKEAITLVSQQTNNNNKQLSELTYQNKNIHRRIELTHTNLNQEIKNNRQQLSLLSAQNQDLVKQTEVINCNIDRTVNKLTDKISKTEKSHNALRGKIDSFDRQSNRLYLNFNEQQKQLDVQKQEIDRLKNTIDSKHTIKKASQVKKLFTVTETVGRIYIDGNNLEKSVPSGNDVDYEQLKLFCGEVLADVDRIDIQYYTGKPHHITVRQLGHHQRLKKLGYNINTLPVSKRDKDNDKTVGDDVKLTADLIQEVKPHDKVILVSGDGDFIPLVNILLNKNIRVTVVCASSSMSSLWHKTFADDDDFNLITLEAIALDPNNVYNIIKRTKTQRPRIAS